MSESSRCYRRDVTIGARCSDVDGSSRPRTELNANLTQLLPICRGSKFVADQSTRRREIYSLFEFYKIMKCMWIWRLDDGKRVHSSNNLFTISTNKILMIEIDRERSHLKFINTLNFVAEKNSTK